VERGRRNETIDIHYLDSRDANNMNFSFVTRMSIPISDVQKVSPPYPNQPRIAFSADGSKFAMAMSLGRVSVWDIRSKVPLKTFTVPVKVPRSIYRRGHVQYLQFSSGKLGKEVLVFVEVCLMFTF